MTVSSGFFNSINHDRLYDAEQLSSIFDGIILDGVYQGVGDAFQVVPYEDANDTVIVKTGRAWFDHTWTLNDSDFSITLSPPNAALDRIDAIVIDVDRTQAVRKNSIKYIAGSYASSPTPPELIKSDLHNQYPICYITVLRGESAPISSSYIQNRVGTSDCPLVTGVLEVMKVDMFVQQMESQFNDWFEGIKDVLDDNTALNLQNQIDDINQRLDDSGSYGINKDAYEFSTTGNIDLISLASGFTEFLTTNANVYSSFLPDGHIVSIIDDGNPVVKAVITDLSGVQISTSDIYTRAHAGALGEPVVVFGELDSYPVKLIVGIHDAVIAANEEYDKSCKLVLSTVTISDMHIISHSESETVVDYSSSVEREDGFCCNNPVYMDDETAVIYCGAGYYKSAGRYTGSEILFKITPEGVVSKTRVEDTISFGDSTQYIIGYKPINSLYGAFDDVVFQSSLEDISVTNKSDRMDLVLGDRKLSEIKYFGKSKSIGLIDGKTYVEIENTYDLSNKKQLPPTIQLTIDINSDSEVTGSSFGGVISPDGKLALIGWNDNALRACRISDNGLLVWTGAYSGSSSEKSDFEQIVGDLLYSSFYGATGNSVNWYIDNSNEKPVYYFILTTLLKLRFEWVSGDVMDPESGTEYINLPPFESITKASRNKLIKISY